MTDSRLTIKPLQPSVLRRNSPSLPYMGPEVPRVMPAIREVQAERERHGKAKMAIDQKYMEIGGETGLPVAEVEPASNDGYLRRYRNGVIYFQPATGARWVHGAILGRYLEFGADAGFLGYPTTDETGTPDGVGRYNHFEHGSIYWSPATGAQEVHGAIRDRWAALGWERSWLGYPLSGEQEYPENGRVSAFQNGAIYWWADTGTREIKDLVVEYTGIHCFGETDIDGGSSRDEPYAAIGIRGPQVGQVFRTQLYRRFNPGEGRFDIIELFRGSPRELELSCVLTEYSGGDTEMSRSAIQEAYNKGTPYVADAITMIPYVGPVLGPLARAGFMAGKEKILDALNGFIEGTLGFANRPLGQDVIAFNAKELILLATRPEGHAQFDSIPWRFETALLSRWGASYKLYFNVYGA